VRDDTALAPGGYFTMLEITINSMRPPHRLPLDRVPSDGRARRPEDRVGQKIATRESRSPPRGRLLGERPASASATRCASHCR